MPDASTGSFFDKIKDFIPVIASAGIGALAGGGPGALAAAGGTAEAEERQQASGEGRQEKLLSLMSLMEERKQTEAYKAQQVQDRAKAEQDREADRQLQLTIMGAHQQEQAKHDAETTQQHEEHEKDWVQQNEANRNERTILAQMVHGENISDDSYKSLIDGAGPSWKNFAGVTDPKLRSLVAGQIIKSNATAGEAVVSSSMKTIADHGYGGDMDKAMADWGDRPPAEIVRAAHAALVKDLKTPDQIKKEFAADAKESSNLAGDLEKADKNYKKARTGGAGKIGNVLSGGAVKEAPARAKAIMHDLYGSTWAGTTPQERTSAEKTLTRALIAKPDMSYSDMATLLRPKGKAGTPRPAAGTSADAAPPEGAVSTIKAKDGSVGGYRLADGTIKWNAGHGPKSE